MGNLHVTPSVPEEGVECYWITQENGVGVADVHGPQSPERERLANQMATAPDLYGALEAAMSFIASHVADPDITPEMVRNYEKLREARPVEALAKARGEQP